MNVIELGCIGCANKHDCVQLLWRTIRESVEVSNSVIAQPQVIRFDIVCRAVLRYARIRSNRKYIFPLVVSDHGY